MNLLNTAVNCHYANVTATGATIMVPKTPNPMLDHHIVVGCMQEILARADNTAQGAHVREFPEYFLIDIAGEVFPNRKP